MEMIVTFGGNLYPLRTPGPYEEDLKHGGWVTDLPGSTCISVGLLLGAIAIDQIGQINLYDGRLAPTLQAPSFGGHLAFLGVLAAT